MRLDDVFAYARKVGDRAKRHWTLKAQEIKTAEEAGELGAAMCRLALLPTVASYRPAVRERALEDLADVLVAASSVFEPWEISAMLERTVAALEKKLGTERAEE